MGAFLVMSSESTKAPPASVLFLTEGGCLPFPNQGAQCGLSELTSPSYKISRWEMILKKMKALIIIFMILLRSFQYGFKSEKLKG